MSHEVKRGVLLMNLGSPESTSTADVRKYLDEFLMDGRVIDKSWLFRALLVKGIIVPFRAPKSAEAYKEIWSENGSPLIVLTELLQQSLQEVIADPVEIAMRYGKPSPKKGFEKLLKRQPALEEVIAVPLYPHYAMSSYETAVEYAKEIHRKYKFPFRLKFVPPFYNETSYINSLAEVFKPFVSHDFDHLLFSYHGVPARHIRKSDITGCHCLTVENCCSVPSPAHEFCYRHQVITTTRLVTEKLNLPSNKFSISFQSRLGKGWLTPFTDIRLQEMPAENIKKLLIVCPAFVSDCLETLEEIEMRGREIFMNAGGESFTMIPCLNTHPSWVQTLKGYVS